MPQCTGSVRYGMAVSTLLQWLQSGGKEERMRTMQAVMKASAAPGAALAEVRVPEPGPGEALVEVRAASICGTDFHVYAWDDWAAGRVHPPRIMGHETAGVVAALGPGAAGVDVGDHVSIETHITCGICHSCRTGQGHICENVQIIGVDRDGSFAQYVAVPAANLWRNPSDMPFDVAAAQEPLGNAVHTVFAGEIAGKSVLITGLGPIGLFAVGVARAAGAGRIIATEVSAYRRRLGEEMGADLVIDPTSAEDLPAIVREHTGGDGVDVVLEMSGHPLAIRDGIRSAVMGGRVSLLGLPSNAVTLALSEDVIMRGITLQGITGRRMFDTWYKARALLESGRLDIAPLITHRFPLSRYADAMDLLHEGSCGKIVLIP